MIKARGNPIIIDTETTGLKQPQAIEVASIQLCEDISYLKSRFTLNSDLSFDSKKNLSVSAIVDSGLEIRNERFKPSKPIDAAASNVHGIYMKDLHGCRPASSYKLPEHSYFIAHNASYDHRVLNKPDTTTICTLQLAKLAFDKDKVEGKLRNFKLVTLIDYILPKAVSGDLLVNAHGALGDCVMTWYLLVEILNRFDHIDTWESLAALCTQPKQPKVKVLDRIPFGKYKGMRFSEIPVEYLTWLNCKSDDPAILLSLSPHLPTSDRPS